MPHWLDPTPWVFALGAFAGVILWFQAWVGVSRSRRLVPTLRLGEELARREPPRGSVCVIVPAHNEARLIAGFIRSLRSETYTQMRVVLALDRCTDETLDIARRETAGDARFEIVEIDACLPDWAGKVHAVHEGLVRSRAAAGAEYLLFVDADTEFTPGCIAASLALMHHRELDMLSLLSTLTYETWFERVVQPAAVMELLTQYPLPRANGGSNRRAFANGQFMLFKRDAYDAIGGHAAVKGALLEDIALARRVEDGREHKSGVFLAAGLFRCRMYRDWQQFRRGWRRIFTESADRKPRRLMQHAWRCRWLGTLVPIWTQAAGVYSAAVVAREPLAGSMLLALWLVATVLWLGTLMRVASAAQAPLWTAPLHVVGSWLTARVLVEAARDIRGRQTLKWAGRDYHLGVKKSS